jgi:gamma-glutamyltranspeptidase/glutathione hydrolase
MKNHLIGIIICSLCLSSWLTQAQVTRAKNGMVVSSSQIASDVGRDLLSKGGNAIDAAVGTAFALAVTWPSAGNLGGGGFIVYMTGDGNATTIDFREKAPLAATETMFLDENGNLIDDINHHSIKAVGVPGTVAGLYLAHQKYGSLPWADVVQPAVGLAENGFPFTWTLYDHSRRFNESVGRFPDLSTYFSNEEGTLVKPGEIWKQADLAKTLASIRDNGQDGFYKGDVANTLAKYMKENGGLITKKDLAKYEAIERMPIKGTYKNFEIFSMPPPSSGGATMIQMLNMMELYDFSEIKFNSAAYIHLQAEVMRRAFADRAQYLGDPDFTLMMPVDQLISKEHAKQRANNLDMEKASPSDSSRFGQMYDGESTTHLSVIDKDGNAVSLTYTLEYSYGSKLVVKGLGFILNNEMGDFNPVPGITTSTGQIGTPANYIKPEKRMLSSMTPTIVAKDGKPYLVIGSPGGRTIINTVYQTVFNVIEHNMPIDKAIAASKIHHQWLPDRILYEKWLVSPDTKEGLIRKGHTLREVGNLGVLMGIIYNAETGEMTGAADSSATDGGASGY